MTETELINIVDKLLDSGHGMGIVLFGAILLKKYVINGTIERFFSLKKSEIDIARTTQKTLLIVIREQKKLAERIDGELRGVGLRREKPCIDS